MKKAVKNNSKIPARAGDEEAKKTSKRLAARNSSPLVRIIRQEILKRNIKQKDMGKLIGMDDSSFSLFMNGKRHLSLDAAKNLHKRLHIDPKLILKYA
ncbi:MAG: helix-turn-helix domain-containing protein [Prevotellaceae bacterium]|jgi:antitoxin component HigA of HigAB toxin-antitoxin module|nr:helix-turn-helix domain-containing protein [Prevotellaceae bacterium]